MKPANRSPITISLSQDALNFLQEERDREGTAISRIIERHIRAAIRNQDTDKPQAMADLAS